MTSDRLRIDRFGIAATLVALGVAGFAAAPALAQEQPDERPPLLSAPPPPAPPLTGAAAAVKKAQEQNGQIPLQDDSDLVTKALTDYPPSVVPPGSTQRPITLEGSSAVR